MKEMIGDIERLNEPCLHILERRLENPSKQGNQNE